MSAQSVQLHLGLLQAELERLAALPEVDLADGTLGPKELIKQFPDHGFDGMRCDMEGNLYITRHGKGTVVVMTPKGQVLREVDVLGKRPTNLCFGGPDGKTVYVTEVDHTRLVRFRVETPGLAWRRWQEK